MSDAFLDIKPRNFNPMSVSGLTKEARDRNERGVEIHGELAQ
jgi:hypothetical protein